jgi:predicted RNA polymerase sigma factor
LPPVRGEVLERLGRIEEARESFAAAAALTGNEAERWLFLKRTV